MKRENKISRIWSGKVNEFCKKAFPSMHLQPLLFLLIQNKSFDPTTNGRSEMKISFHNRFFLFYFLTIQLTFLCIKHFHVSLSLSFNFHLSNRRCLFFFLLQFCVFDTCLQQIIFFFSPFTFLFF